MEAYQLNMPIMFDVTLSNPLQTARAQGRYSRHINFLTAAQFSDSFLSKTVASAASSSYSLH